MVPETPPKRPQTNENYLECDQDQTVEHRNGDRRKHHPDHRTREYLTLDFWVLPATLPRPMYRSLGFRKMMLACRRPGASRLP